MALVQSTDSREPIVLAAMLTLTDPHSPHDHPFCLKPLMRFSRSADGGWGDNVRA